MSADEFRKWSPAQQRLYFRMYRHMRLNQAEYMPKGEPALPKPAWNVISGAAARMAAHLLEAEPQGDTFAATLIPE